ncbi:MAG TPA: S8 family serine peptidase, partial [Ferruginibacter sp.]|nr:S8 family serine peptidase [Ferruginibacter sp.]
MNKFYLEKPIYFIKNSRLLVLIIFLLLTDSQVFSQSKKEGFEDSVFTKYQSHQITNNSSYYVIQKANEQASCGFKIIRIISPFVNIIRINDPLLLQNKIICAHKIAAANDLWKLSPGLENSLSQLSKTNATHSFIISADDINQLLNNWKEKKLPVKILNVYKESKAAIIHCKASVFINDLLPDSLLLFADQYIKATSEVMLIGYNRSLHTINLVQNDIPAANGHDIIIGIKENRMNETDIDLQKRINTSVLASAEQDEHATVVATLAGGAGNSFYSGKGLAWKCRFYPSSYASLFPDNTSTLFQNNVSVQNHSYGSIIQNFYGAEAVAYDAQTWQNKNIVHVFSSGNKGQEAALQGKYSNIPGYGNLTGNFKMSKNIITVAATDTGGNSIAFSSAGPLYDGRMAPQIAALGPNGTSDAAAIVSGAVAVLQQVYKDSNNQLLPTSALIKSILYNSANDIGNKGIDYRSGFGSLNVYEAIKTIQEKRFDGASLAQSETWIKT